MLLKKKTALWILILPFFLACPSKETSKPLFIATAANMQFAMKDIAQAFENKTGQQCELIIGSSGKLTAQILEGAPYDLFVSADTKYPNSIYKKNKSTSSPQIYALGKLVIWSTSKNQIPSLDFIIENNIKIAIANPETAPYGRASQEALEKSGLIEKIKYQLIYGESIAQVNRFVETQNVDYGITSLSSVLSDALNTKGVWAPIADSLYQDIEQSVIVIRQSEKPRQEAEDFKTFLFSKETQKILLRYGYQVVKEE